ncbi:MAG: hypothetical protein FWE18_04470 [Alphaproteobacteria bacterium]|nr:hypothetical protein [Alphaproteobacteria bacterium]
MRSTEFTKELFQEKAIKFEELNSIDKMRYSLIYNYGDKLGGYLGVASLSLFELIKINKFFVDFEKNTANHINTKE